MDTITQAALGALIGEAAFRRRLGGGAVIAGAIGGTIPDLDQLFSFGGDSFAYIRVHRALSHSLVFAIGAALLLGWLAQRWRGRRTRDWIGVFFWSLVTHPLLDICTTYGTLFLMPISYARLAVDAVAVLDLFYTLPLLIALVICHRARANPIKTMAIAWLTLGLTTAYLADGWRISREMNARAEAALRAQGVTPVEVRSHPGMFQLWGRRVVARDSADDLHIGFASSSKART
jgi:inner membrane protein